MKQDEAAYPPPEFCNDKPVGRPGVWRRLFTAQTIFSQPSDYVGCLESLIIRYSLPVKIESSVKVRVIYVPNELDENGIEPRSLQTIDRFINYWNLPQCSQKPANETQPRSSPFNHREVAMKVQR